jgi:hypothetical protein
MTWLLHRPSQPRPATAADQAGGRRGGGDVDESQRLARLPDAVVAPEAFVAHVDAGDAARDSSSYPTSDEPVEGNSAIPSDQRFGRDSEPDGKRDELSFERERVEAFHRLLEYPPWRAHAQRPPRTSAENDWWLTQS